ncbi:MAG: hypothetical protein ABIJ41_06150 [Candidatus Omnitrophota bacterium]
MSTHKKLLSFVFVLLLLAGFGCAKKEKPAITIDQIQITADEFEDAFHASRFVMLGEEGRKAFLESYISTKLILKEAEKMGLDKDPEFLKDIQFFWETALLKLVMTNESKALASSVQVTDQDIRSYYQAHKDSRFKEKELSAVYDQIKWLLLQDQQGQAMTTWTDSLKNKAHIKIDYGRLGLTP